jgi:hypothetical protein
MAADKRIAPSNDGDAWSGGQLTDARRRPRLKGQAAQRAWALGVWEDEGGALAQLCARNVIQRVRMKMGLLGGQRISARASIVVGPAPFAVASGIPASSA